MSNLKEATATNGTAENNPGTAAPEFVANFPLFFTSPHVISLERHAEASLRKDKVMAFARNTNVIPLTLADIPQAAKHYPIVFTMGDNIMPVAVVGLEQQNYFVDADGNWLERAYVPYYVRKYPFIFIEDRATDKLTLCVDEAALILDGKKDGHKLYENGKPSVYIHNALELCAIYHEQYRYTQDFCKELKQNAMLSEQQCNVELASGRTFQMKGLQLIDLDNFKTLPEPLVFDWYKRSVLEFIYYTMQSHSNWGNLLELANKSEGRAQNTKG